VAPRGSVSKKVPLRKCLRESVSKEVFPKKCLRESLSDERFPRKCLRESVSEEVSPRKCLRGSVSERVSPRKKSIIFLPDDSISEWFYLRNLSASFFLARPNSNPEYSIERILFLYTAPMGEILCVVHKRIDLDITYSKRMAKIESSTLMWTLST